MIKFGTIFRNIASAIIFALALLLIYGYVSGMLAPVQEDDTPVINEETSGPVPTVPKSELEQFLETLTLSVQGETVTDVYDSSSVRLTLADLSAYSISDKLSLSKTVKSCPVRVPDKLFGTYTTVFEDREYDRIQLELYDGKLIIDRGDRRELYDENGALISDNFVLTPAFLRDSAKNALYTDEGGAYYTVQSGALLPAEYTQSSPERLILYENTPDKAADTGFTVASKQDEDGLTLLALCSSDGKLLTDYLYTRIFAFSEGLAAACLPDGSISYINENGKVQIKGVHTFKNTSDRYVDKLYALPDTFGAESMGFVYFDSGIVLVREKTVDYVYKENTISDTTSVIRDDGQHLSLPGGYNVISASDGAVVVEKDGKYGVFTRDERWALQPVYDGIEPYYEGLAVVKMGEKSALFDTKGNMILPALFDYISPVSQGRIIAYSNDCGFILFEKQKISA